MAGVGQNTVNRFLGGKNKRFDAELASKLMTTLNIAEDDPVYGVTAVHRPLTPEEEGLLQIMEAMPAARQMLEAFIQLPERQRTIQLGKMLEKLEEVEAETKKGA